METCFPNYVQKLMEEDVMRQELYSTYSTAHEARAYETNHTPPAVASLYIYNLFFMIRTRQLRNIVNV
ncbi:hypothetical protein CHS0354_021357 [Potamilus streckersoni]|uniref:Uncharacterized protein n=1 Tax=Potamilus streckersoni TaxID=2493646 RepID=A0AAE0VPR8_9BIVA|nr:hypothetical protein CHS0354_021357 [Potamilus streckersoni]